jgi:hypothetical protein
MMISASYHVWPGWAPDWLREQVEASDCSAGTHPRLRRLAEWLTIYFAEHEGAAAYWLRYAAARCDRQVPPGEVDHLLVWAGDRFGSALGASQNYTPSQYASSQHASARPQVDLEEIYEIALGGPRLKEYREGSPQQLGKSRKTDEVLDAWGRYAGQADPFVCFGADDSFWTRPYSAVRNILHCHAQIVPSPMRALLGLTANGRWSEHTKDGTGERMFLVTEFDFTKTTPKGQPTIWGPLLESCEAAGITVLDLNAALLAHLSEQRPLWMAVFSGGKSLQGWFPCRGEPEAELQHWFVSQARRLGADPMTWCKSQFVRMPDGTRAPNREGKSVRQTIEYYDPSVL